MRSSLSIFSARYIILSVLITLVISCELFQADSITATKLKTEYLTNPLGLDVSSPRFSWVPNSSDRGANQSAYRIIVSHDRDAIEENTGDQWDSGQVNSSQSVNLHYDGKELKSGEKYYWKVKVWDESPSRWSAINSFQMGLLDFTDWKAAWITDPDSTVSAPLFRKEFTTDKEIESAYVYVTGVGYYELYLNGKKVGDHVLDPAMTDYRKRVLYETYDVKGLLKDGKNALGLMLGNGPWRVLRQDDRYTFFTSYHSFGTPRGLIQMQITYSDGTQSTVSSDGSWKTSAGPITYNNLYGGEDYDARREQDGWKKVGFDDSDWKGATETEAPGGLDSQLMPPIRVTKTIQPIKQIHPDENTYLFDLGENIAGWWQVHVSGERGTKLKIRGSETLNNQQFPTPLKAGDSLSTNKDYHKNVGTTYTLKGKEPEVYEPRFFYTGFRYIEVKVEEPGTINNLSIAGRMVHSDLQKSGHYSSSDSLLNQIYAAAIRSQRSNQLGYPSDCPHREKGAYNGDGQVIAETSMHDFQMRSFYQKWLNDMQDAQLDNGRIPNTAPTVIGGTGGGIAWGSAHVLIPWWIHQYYGDKQILVDHYASMQKYMQYLKNLAANDEHPDEKYIINEFGGYWDSLGEWEAPVRDRTGPVNPLTNTYYWYLDVTTFAKIAEALGKTEVRNDYLSLADSIKHAFNDKFFNPKTNLYGTDEPYQGYLLFALSGNIVPEDHRQAVLDNLIDDIMVKSDGHLGTGILGTKHLFSVLADAGRKDVLQKIVTQKTFPSWGYWIENGATTLWEAWNGKSSHNHQMFGTVNEYFYEYLAGIRAPTKGETTAGYGTVSIKPYVPEGLSHVEASLETIHGTVKSGWTQDSNEFNLEVSLPTNTSGKISVPIVGFKNVVVSESGEKIWDGDKLIGKIKGVRKASREDHSITFEIASGSYSFRLTELK